MKVKYLANILVEGEHKEQGETEDLEEDLAKELIKIGRAEKYVPKAKDEKKEEKK